MRQLWNIEIAALEAIAEQYPDASAVLRSQISASMVSKWENSGAGFFTHLIVPPEADILVLRSPIGHVHFQVEGVEHGLGFVLFLAGGRADMLEGYTLGGSSTEHIDFEQVRFDAKLALERS
jgi:hypothetical protein